MTILHSWQRSLLKVSPSHSTGISGGSEDICTTFVSLPQFPGNFNYPAIMKVVQLCNITINGFIDHNNVDCNAKMEESPGSSAGDQYSKDSFYAFQEDCFY